MFSLIQVDSLSIVVLDWDSLSSPDVLGAVTLPSSLMRRIASSPIGYQTCWHATGTKTDPELSKYDLMPCRWWGESRLEVQLDGKVLLGNDGQRCVVHLRVETLAAAATLEPPSPIKNVLEEVEAVVEVEKAEPEPFVAVYESSESEDENSRPACEVHIDTVRATCLCWRNCHQVAALTKQPWAVNGEAVFGELGRPRFSEMICPVLRHRHLTGQIRIVGL